MNVWARGGLAYAQGRRGEASSLRREVVAADAAWGIGWAAMVFGQSEPWSLAAFYGDPRRELDDLLQREAQLRGLGNNLRATLAAAYSAHLDGNHDGAVRLMRQARFDPAATTDPTLRALAAQFLSAEAIEAGSEAEAWQWLRYAIDGGNAPLLRAFVYEMTMLANHSFGAVKATQLRNQLCNAAPNACFVAQQRPLAQSPTWRSPQAPQQQTKPNNWNRPWAKPKPTGGG